MSRRRRSRTTVVASSSDEEDAAPAPSRAARRAALQLSQSTAGSGGTSSAGVALATLLAGSKPLGPSQQPAEPKPRRSGRALTQPKKAAAGGAGAKAAAARKAAAPPPAAEPSQAQAAAAAAAAGQAGELWTDKHAPASEADLVVHKKKVQEVREWLEEQRATLGRPSASRLLVVTGAGWGGWVCRCGVMRAVLAHTWAVCLGSVFTAAASLPPRPRPQARRGVARPPPSRAWRQPRALLCLSGGRQRRWAGRRLNMPACSAGACGWSGRVLWVQGSRGARSAARLPPVCC